MSKELIKNFYKALQDLDYQTMQGCYHEEATFTDPIFGKLSIDETRLMWKMLCVNARDFALDFNHVIADSQKGSCKVKATYTFSKTKRKVVNSIEANFEFLDGMIISHVDSFDFWKWSRQALGFPGYLFGWTSWMREKVHKEAKHRLSKYLDSHSEP